MASGCYLVKKTMALISMSTVEDRTGIRQASPFLKEIAETISDILAGVIDRVDLSPFCLLTSALSEVKETTDRI